MKKQYNQPNVEMMKVCGGFVMNTTSSVVNNDPLQGGGGSITPPEGN